jgi:hypothetical protein
VDDAQLHRVVDLDLEQRLFERLDGTGDVALDDEVERLDLALFESTGEVLERDALAGLGQLGVALGGLALLGDLAGQAVLLGDDEGVAGAGTEFRPCTWTGRDGQASSTASPFSSIMARTRP